ncbi:MAG: 30S ribosomal protein S1 [Gemmatales bacterium]|nr:30S ribosomal protein S1 [Gemmatales bacterium]MDW8385419.1 30S ribosomal protein S1 [Gemmatales bacterium]
MVNRNLIQTIPVTDDELEQAFSSQPGASTDTVIQEMILSDSRDFEPNRVITGKVREVRENEVVVDVGYKSEGIIPLEEWKEEGTDQIVPPKVGDEIRVLLESVDDEDGVISLSYRKAKRQEEWEKIIRMHKEGDVVTGVVTRKIKGGLLVNIGVNVFLPASQVDIRRPSEIGDYIGKEVRCKILKIDEARRNIVVSRRKLIEDERAEKKAKLLAEIAPGQIRKGVVKSITEFGAFVDLGGIDGLLHITDMSWGRVAHPSDVVSIDQEIEVYVISVDREKERIAVGLKQKTPSPWQDVEKKYPVGSRHKGEVVNVMNYGAFVKLEDGIEGLVHISEMSWTKRINHPNEVVSIGDKIEVEILNINKEKQEISLGMKQCQPNPWDKVAERYPPGTIVTGTVRNLTNYGAFVEIEEGIDGLLHVSDMSWVRKVAHPSEVVQKGDKVRCVVLNVDQERKRVALGMKQLANDPWETDIPARYHPGLVLTGKVTKITNFGVFVELEPGLEGLIHVSELADHKVDKPEEIVKVGDPIEVKVLRVDPADRKIGLSHKRAGWDGSESAAESAPSAGGTAAKRELKGGTGSGGGGQLFSMPESQPESKSN